LLIIYIKHSDAHLAAPTSVSFEFLQFNSCTAVSQNNNICIVLDLDASIL